MFYCERVKNQYRHNCKRDNIDFLCKLFNSDDTFSGPNMWLNNCDWLFWGGVQRKLKGNQFCGSTLKLCNSCGLQGCLRAIFCPEGNKLSVFAQIKKVFQGQDYNVGFRLSTLKLNKNPFLIFFIRQNSYKINIPNVLLSYCPYYTQRHFLIRIYKGKKRVFSLFFYGVYL